MRTRVHPKALNGTIEAISSKSDAHRALICSALSDKPTYLSLNCLSVDIEATISCLEAMGAKVISKSSMLEVNPIWDNYKESPSLDCIESGSTLRFLMPVAAALGNGAIITGRGRLPQRPIVALTDALEKHGCGISGNQLPVKISGKLEGGNFELPGDVSSQFITGLLFALPMLEHDSKINLTSPLQSRGYVNMTINSLSKFGIYISQAESSFSVSGNQKFKSPQAYAVEGDWSNAAFWLSAGAIGGCVTCTGLSEKSLQGDRKITEILKQFGADVYSDNINVRVTRNNLKGIEIDAAEIPDLIPILSVVAAFAEGKTRIYNAERLRLKESDRLSAIADFLGRLGGKVEEKLDGLIIFGQGGLIGGTVNSFSDHRIAMSAAVAATMCSGEVIIKDSQAVNKSYPNFFRHFNELGGISNVI